MRHADIYVYNIATSIYTVIKDTHCYTCRNIDIVLIIGRKYVRLYVSTYTTGIYGIVYL